MRTLVPADLEGWGAKSVPFSLQSAHARVVEPWVSPYFVHNNSRRGGERNCFEDALDHQAGSVISVERQDVASVNLQKADFEPRPVRLFEIVDCALDRMRRRDFKLHRRKHAVVIIAMYARDNFATDAGSEVGQNKIKKVWTPRWLRHKLPKAILAANCFQLCPFRGIPPREPQPTWIMEIHISHDNAIHRMVAVQG